MPTWQSQITPPQPDGTKICLVNGKLTICPGGVTSNELADGAVTAAKIAAGAVQSSHIADGAVTSTKIGTGAVQTDHIADGAVTSAKIAAAAVTRDKLALPLSMIKNSGAASSVTVTETTSTLKQEVGPDTGFSYFVYIERIHVLANNPAGSGCSLYFQLKALLDNGDEVALSDVVEVPEGSSFDDWLVFLHDAVTNGRAIKSIRLYAYVSAAPATGYEPTVQLERVVGVQV